MKTRKRHVDLKTKSGAVAAGNAALFADLFIETGDLGVSANALRREGQTVLMAAVDGRAAGLVGAADPLKSTAAEAVRELTSSGIKGLMVTGDNAATTGAVAGKLGIE